MHELIGWLGRDPEDPNRAAETLARMRQVRPRALGNPASQVHPHGLLTVTGELARA